MYQSVQSLYQSCAGQQQFLLMLMFRAYQQSVQEQGGVSEIRDLI